MFSPNIKKLKEKGNTKALVKSLTFSSSSDGKTPVIRQQAADALDELGWVPQNDKELCYYLLGKQGWQELKSVKQPAVKLLMDRLKGLDADYAWISPKDIQFTALALAEIGAVEAIDLILNHIQRQVLGQNDRYKDKDSVISSLVNALEKMGRSHIQPYIQRLIQKGFTYHDPGAITPGLFRERTVRSNYALVLARLGDLAFDELVEALISEQSSNQGHSFLDAFSIKEYSAFTLGEMRDQRAVRPLILNLKKYTCDEYRERPIYEYSGGMSIHEAAAVQKMCAQIVIALGKTRDPQAIPVLHACFEGQDKRFWSEAAQALGEIGDQTALPLLTRVLNHAGLFDRGEIKKAISRIEAGRTTHLLA
jgi:HEAT repeat protein